MIVASRGPAILAPKSRRIIATLTAEMSIRSIPLRFPCHPADIPLPFRCLGARRKRPNLTRNPLIRSAFSRRLGARIEFFFADFPCRQRNQIAAAGSADRCLLLFAVALHRQEQRGLAACHWTPSIRRAAAGRPLRIPSPARRRGWQKAPDPLTPTMPWLVSMK